MKRLSSIDQTLGAVVVTLLAGSLTSAALLMVRMISADSLRYWFLMWNLVLAWVPLAFAWWLIVWLRGNRWRTWQGIALTIAWLSFLPNSFYIISDFVHLYPTGEVSMLFDALMLLSFAWNGMLLGFIGLYMVHAEMSQRWRREYVTPVILGVLLLCSFAIYLGRYLSWNSWDILLNSGGLAVDISDRLLRPASHVNTFTTTSLFMFVLTAIYFVMFRLVRILRTARV